MTTNADGISEMPRDWLIRKGGYFYRPDRAGYTGNVQEAGRYTQAEAEAESWRREGVTAHHESEFPAVTCCCGKRIRELELALQNYMDACRYAPEASLIAALRAADDEAKRLLPTRVRP